MCMELSNIISLAKQENLFEPISDIFSEADSHDFHDNMITVEDAVKNP